MHDDEDSQREHSSNNSGSAFGGIIGLVIIIALGWWAYNTFFGADTSKPWWDGTAYQRVCAVHVAPDDAYCDLMAVTVQDERITTLVLPDSLGRNGESVVISTNDCDKATTEGGLAGKDKRYCVIGEIGGGREWQVSES